MEGAQGVFGCKLNPVVLVRKGRKYRGGVQGREISTAELHVGGERQQQGHGRVIEHIEIWHLHLAFAMRGRHWEEDPHQ